MLITGLYIFNLTLNKSEIPILKIDLLIGYLTVAFGLVSRVFTNGPGDLGSMPDRVIPKTQKMVLDVALLNTQYYKVRIKGKLEEWSSALPYTLV